MHSYTSGYCQYTDFCSHSGYQPLPTSEAILCQFVSLLEQQQFKHKTIRSYLSSIRFFHITNNGNDPFIRDMPRLQYVLCSINSEEAKKDKQSRPHLPVTPAILTQIHHILRKDPSNFDFIMLWSASLLCFFGFLRSGEMTIPSLHSYDPTVHLNYNNISVDNPANPAIVKVRPMCSKTDPFCHRVDVHVGETGQILCPISALFNYLVVHRKDRGLLFHFSVGSPLLFSVSVCHNNHFLSGRDVKISIKFF